MSLSIETPRGEGSRVSSIDAQNIGARTAGGFRIF